MCSICYHIIAAQNDPTVPSINPPDSWHAQTRSTPPGHQRFPGTGSKSFCTPGEAGAAPLCTIPHPYPGPGMGTRRLQIPDARPPRTETRGSVLFATNGNASVPVLGSSTGLEVQPQHRSRPDLDPEPKLWGREGMARRLHQGGYRVEVSAASNRPTPSITRAVAVPEVGFLDLSRVPRSGGAIPYEAVFLVAPVSPLSDGGVPDFAVRLHGTGAKLVLVGDGYRDLLRSPDFRKHLREGDAGAWGDRFDAPLNELLLPTGFLADQESPTVCWLSLVALTLPRVVGFPPSCAGHATLRPCQGGRWRWQLPSPPPAESFPGPGGVAAARSFAQRDWGVAATARMQLHGPE